MLWSNRRMKWTMSLIAVVRNDSAVDHSAGLVAAAAVADRLFGSAALGLRS